MTAQRSKEQFEQDLKCLRDDYLSSLPAFNRIDEKNRSQVLDECRLLMFRVHDLLPDLMLLRDKGILSDDEFFIGRSHCGCVLQVVGQAYRKMGMLESACIVLQEARNHSPHIAHVMESLVYALLAAGREVEAANVVNFSEPSLIASENDSTAAHLIEWASTHFEFASSISADKLKYCIELIAQYREMKVLQMEEGT